MSASPALQTEPQDIVALATEAGAAAKKLVAEATRRVRTRVLGSDGKIDAAKLETEQHAAHGLAWLAVYGEAVRELGTYASNLQAAGKLGETETLLVKIGAGEYLDQMFGGIPMSQGEMVRPTSSLGLSGRELAQFRTSAIEAMIAEGNTPENRAALVARIRDGGGSATVGDSGLDEDMEAIRSEMRRFGKAEVVDQAHEWHLKNAYIPMEIIEKMAELGVFGLTIPEEYGGMGMPKAAMCVVSEELSLYRRRLARHPLGDRRRAHPRWRHRGAEAEVPAEDRQRRDPAHRRLHRAEHRLRPREPAHQGREGR